VSFAGKIVVLGLGNPYMHDDGVGVEVANDLRKKNLGDKVLVYDYRAIDLSLLSYIDQSSKIIVVDALRVGEVPGTVSKYSVSKAKSPLQNLPNLHELRLHDIVDLATQSSPLSRPLVVVGIEPKDCTPGEGLSDEVKIALPKATYRVLEELNLHGENSCVLLE
jgi:hydrogenase maturation protease